ncbi:MAG: hypothetical protein ABIT16_05615 [Croceibacterium sp.]
MRPGANGPLAAAVITLALASCASGPSLHQRAEGRLRANPGQVVATELAFARAAQEDGQWTAFNHFADGDAVMFVPEAVRAKDWLKGRANPANAVRWQPAQVWSSCDGTLAVTKGPWQRANGTVGYFTTVWKRQRNDEYRWVMDQGDGLQQPLAVADMIGGKTAACNGQPTPPADLLAGPADTINAGVSRDGTLRWQVVTHPDGSRMAVATYWDGSAWQDAIRETVSAQ